jgi:branched-chain amino acid transport system ATP-binding protein
VSAGGEQLLRVEDLATGYRRKQVVFGVSLQVQLGEVVALIGHNGAGKTTTLKAIAGLLPAWSGRIRLDGEPVEQAPSATRVRRGLAFIPQERFVFADLTVTENLELGAFTVPDAARAAERRETVFALLPVLAERRRQLAGTLSGGEQRMLSLGMALMMRPRVLLLDEPSLGLSPLLVERIMETIQDIVRREQLTVLLVEQNVRHALGIATRVYVMRTGRVILEESGTAMAARGEWWNLF